jgi:hypothetical protein
MIKKVPTLNMDKNYYDGVVKKMVYAFEEKLSKKQEKEFSRNQEH